MPWLIEMLHFWWLNIFGIASHDHFYMISRIPFVFITLFFSDTELIRSAFKLTEEAEEQSQIKILLNPAEGCLFERNIVFSGYHEERLFTSPPGPGRRAAITYSLTNAAKPGSSVKRRFKVFA